jgi:hypothetical protein
MSNKAVKPFAALTRTSGAPRLFAHGSAMIAQTPLRTSRRLPGRYAQKGRKLTPIQTILTLYA